MSMEPLYQLRPKWDSGKISSITRGKWFKEILKDFSMGEKVKRPKFDLSQTSLSWTKIFHDHSHPDVI